MSCPERIGIGAYVLGVLDADEQRRFRAHLEKCPLCAAEAAELRDLPRLLSTVPLDDLPDERVLPSGAAYDRLRAAAQEAVAQDEAAARDEAARDEAARDELARRRRRRRPVLAALTAAAAVVLGVVLVGPGGLRPGGDRAPAGSVVVAATSGPVWARATLHRTDTGAGIALTLAGVPPHEHCILVAVGTDGRRETAGTWTATYAGAASVTGWVSLEPAQIDRLVVQTSSGHTLLTLPAPPD